MHPRPRVFLPALAATLALAGLGATVLAQIEGGERGVPPIDSSGAFEVTGIDVDVTATTADAARLGGWREAQRKGWRALWSRTHGGAAAPNLPDSALDGIVSGIVIEEEQIGPRRYIARLGVLFDRARAGQILGISGQIMRSPPMLVIPVQLSGGVHQSFETRTPWQQAWARYRTGNSPIDYVRPSGTGADPMLLNVAQAGRPGRRWWRNLLDQYGAADVLIPQVRLRRLWPGGPIIGHFSARHGPDDIQIGTFSLRVENSEALPRLLDEGVRRIDQLYINALRSGRLRPDPSLIIEDPVDPEELEEGDLLPVETIGDPLANGGLPTGATAITVQFETPDVASVGAGESSVRSIPGVRSASTTSLALGGVSVMRVAFDGDLAALRAALAARGWEVGEINGALRIRRGGGGRGGPESPQPSNATAPRQ